MTLVGEAVSGFCASLTAVKLSSKYICMVIADLKHETVAAARQCLVATKAEEEAGRLPWEKPRQWREALPGYELLCGQIPDKLIYRLLVLHKARHFWNRSNPPGRKWFTVARHREFTGKMLAQFALANGWSQPQTAFLLEAWRYRHDLPLHDVDLRQMLATGMRATEGLRNSYRLQKEQKMKGKTSYRIVEFLTENGPSGPAEVAQQLGISRETAKKALQRLTAAEDINKVGRGKYSAGTQTGTPLVKELDKESKTKKEMYSITQGVPALSPSSNGTLGDYSVDPNRPSSGREKPSPEQLYLRQIEFNPEPDGDFTVNPPSDGPTPEQELKLRADFERWKRELEAFSLAHPEALAPKLIRPIVPINMQSDPAPRLKTMVAWSAPAVDYDSGPSAEFSLRR